MIISHTHRYLFIELPQTGSSAVARELRQLYDGKKILTKHATYRDFLRIATDEELQYFVFSGIRNPMDKALSLYFKYKTSHSKRTTGHGYDDPELYRESSIFVSWLMRKQYSFIRSHDADFADFFARFYWIPYDDWSCLDHERLDFVIHFERLAVEFEEALHRIGIKPQRQLPARNKTRDRNADFWSYYTPDLHRRAQWVFGPYFRRWGYSFPDDWPPYTVTASEIILGLANVLRKLYWRHIRATF